MFAFIVLLSLSWTGHVVLPGCESLRVEFDRLCSTEKRHDPLTLMDGIGRIMAIRSGRDWADWSQEVRIQGNELRWRFTSDGSVNGWGWRFTVYPVISPGIVTYLSTSITLFTNHFALHVGLNLGGVASSGGAQSERLLLAQPSISAVACLLDSLIKRLCGLSNGWSSVASRLAIALARCAQQNSLCKTAFFRNLAFDRILFSFFFTL